MIKLEQFKTLKSLINLENELLFIKGSYQEQKYSTSKKSVKNITKLTTKEKVEVIEKLKKIPEKKKK